MTVFAKDIMSKDSCSIYTTKFTTKQYLFGHGMANKPKINYGIKSNTSGNIIGIYINGINNSNTNIETTSNSTTSNTIILNLNSSDTISLGVINATNNSPLNLQDNTISAYITIISLD